MRVLVVSPFVPLPADNGSKIRTLEILESLAGHEVRLIAFREPGGPGAPAGLREVCREAVVFDRPRIGTAAAALNHVSLRPLLAKRFSTAEARDAASRIVREARVDLLVLETLLVAEYGRGAGRPAGPRVLLDEHNLEFIRAARRAGAVRGALKRAYCGLIAARLKSYEAGRLRAADGCLTCSEEDRRVVLSLAPGRDVTTVPNPVDTEFFRPGESPAAGPPTILFLGMMGYEANADAAVHFYRRILPRIRAARPETEWLVVGEDPPVEIRARSGERGLTITGRVEDVRPYLARSWILAAPIRMGSGTRSKILTAMAAGLPVVSTPTGCEGLGAEDGRDLLVGRTDEEFAAQALRALGDTGLRRSLAAGGRRLVEERYSRPAVRAVLRGLWRRLEEEPRRA